MADAQYWPGLDGMRAAAVVAVVAGHALPARFEGGGAVGVSMFFVLSGFLITNLLAAEHERTATVRLPDFYRRRAARLLPALFLLLAGYLVLCAFGALHDRRHVVVVSVVSAVLYATNFVRDAGTPFGVALGHLWTLATEEQFYLLWPLLLAFLLRRAGRRTVIAVTIGLAVAFALARLTLEQARHPLWATMYFSPASWADALLLGCALGLAVRWGYLAKVPTRAVSVLGATSLVALAWWSFEPTVWPTMWQGELSLVAVAGAFVVLWCVRCTPRLLGARPARELGRCSYGVYLWSLPMVAAFNHGTPKNPSHSTAFAGVAAALGIAWLSFRFVEQPARRLIAGERGAARPSARADGSAQAPGRASTR